MIKFNDMPQHVQNWFLAAIEHTALTPEFQKMIEETKATFTIEMKVNGFDAKFTEMANRFIKAYYESVNGEAEDRVRTLVGPVDELVEQLAALKTKLDKE